MRLLYRRERDESGSKCCPNEHDGEHREFIGEERVGVLEARIGKAGAPGN